MVKSLTKSEKRNFKLYVNRLQAGNETKFLQLFDVLDRLSEYQEEKVLQRLPGVEKKHLPNLKRHLYKQVLVSLRLINKENNIDIQIREQMDFARILYGKGLYMQSLKILDRISKLAYDNHQDLLHLEILEFQKIIEARHITRSRSVKDKMENLLQESSRRSRIAHTTSKLSNLNIKIQGWYIQFGHINNEKEASVFKEYFMASIDGGEYSGLNPDLTFFEKINLYQAYLWYNYVLLEFEKCLFHSTRWVELFEVETQMGDKDPDLYIRGLYYQLTFAFFERDTWIFDRAIIQLEEFLDKMNDKLNTNSKVISFVYLNLSRLNYLFMTKTYDHAPELIEEIQKKLLLYEPHMDMQRILLFYYKFAGMYFCLGDYSQALKFLNEIIHHKTDLLQEDLHVNSRLLQLMCHFELKEYDFMSNYLIPSISRSFGKSRSQSMLPKTTLNFLKSIAKNPERDQDEAFEKFRLALNKLMVTPIEQKAALYLDVPLWVENHLKKKNDTTKQPNTTQASNLP